MAIEKLACNTGRNDENPNIELAEELCAKNDVKGMQEIKEGLFSNDEAVASDCIKVMYEAAQRKPDLAAEYVPVFITLLKSKKNRMVWGAMTALAYTAHLKADVVFSEIDVVKKAYEKGSVITVDNSISVFSSLCKADAVYEKELFPLLVKHLEACRPKEVCQHAERMLICITKENRSKFLSALEGRAVDLTEVQMKRLRKIMKTVQEL